MKLKDRLSTLLLRLLGIRFLVLDRKLDARGIPTAACPNCGERWMHVALMFDEETYEISAWQLEGECVSCGTILTVCCPVDKDAERYI